LYAKANKKPKGWGKINQLRCHMLKSEDGVHTFHQGAEDEREDDEDGCAVNRKIVKYLLLRLCFSIPSPVHL
jgi:hypothetical protein